MKKIFFLALALLISSCKTSEKTIDNTLVSIVDKFANTITSEGLKKHLYIYASDDFEGRLTGEVGQKKAVEYLKKVYIENKIKGGYTNGKYFQPVPSEFLSNNRRGIKLKDSENVLAFIKGSKHPEEVLVISAHLDHLGVENEKVFYGADDNSSGTVAIIEIAKAFKKAIGEGYRPKRSILFLHVTGEEKGLLGSKYYSLNPVYPLSKTVANLNMDMIGRVDDRHAKKPNYIYLIGSDKLSTELHNVSEKVGKKYKKINLDYTYNAENDPNRYYYRSDHYNFAKHNIPVIFYFSGIHEDYHKPTDTPDKIEYDLLKKRTRLIFYTAWEIVNRTDRISVDKAR